ncbi:autotransporter family protein [Bradyrhizobium campsiandrae]|uniref:Autotransporter domain-containing protein n=2 Tax=Bradyrhizobium campsiandrae TaxID=1729892 RepID=A0ABR7UID7_9BRAD|nr:autotransporter outer membrane beta-barrel domain-containing protein [Bradyrhizobium campsiandrae]MBC9983873.1 autotransporter domain-containing protein [Bradyrhizobium campsiandrae]
MRTRLANFNRVTLAVFRVLVLLALAQTAGIGSALAATTCADINGGAFNVGGADNQSSTLSLTAGDVITLNYTFIVDTTFFYGIELGVGGHYADGSSRVSGTLRITVATTGTQTLNWHSLSEGMPSQIDVTVVCTAAVIPGPVVTSANPASGPVAGQQTTIVTGQNLTGATSVKFGGVNVLGFTVLSATQISVITPPHAAGAVDVTVTTPLGTGTGTAIYRYAAMPDPTTDPTVKAMVDFQVHTVQVMGQQQIDNVQDRLTELHNDDVPLVSNRAAFAQIPAPQRHYGLPADASANAGASSDAALPAAKPRDAQAAPEAFGSDSSLRYWTAGSLQFGRDTTYADAKYNVSSTGMTAGVDTHLTRNLKAGVAIGFGIDHATIGSNGSRIDASVWSTQAYASYRVAPLWFIDGVVGYAGGRLANYRYDGTALAFGSGERGAGDLFGSLAVNHEIKLDRWKITPYARFDLQWIRLDGYAETGAGIYNLTFNQASAVDLASMLGTKFSHSTDTAAGTLKSSVELAYRHSFNGGYTQFVAYSLDPATPYSLFGLAEKRDQALIGLGLELQVNKSLSLSARFDELIANQARSERGRAQVKFGF